MLLRFQFENTLIARTISIQFKTLFCNSKALNSSFAFSLYRRLILLNFSVTLLISVNLILVKKDCSSKT